MDEVLAGSSDAGSCAPWRAAGGSFSLFVFGTSSVFVFGISSVFGTSSGFGLGTSSVCEGGVSSLFRVVQELFQKERIAARALDASKRDGMSCVDETSGQAQRLLPSQWTEIDGREWRSTATCAPRSVERVALDTRGHDQKAGTIRHRRGKRRKMFEHLRISPVKILHNDQHRSGAAAARDERRRQFAFAAVTSGVVHGVIKRAPLACLRQVEQVMKKNEPLRRDGPFSDQTLGRPVS